MEDTIKIRAGIKTTKVGSNTEDIIEIPKEDWENMSDLEKDKEILDSVFEMGMAEFYYDIID